ncbi:MAG: Na+/H+ antiporter subunit E [Mogibacterium sp.]|nr:Na+/H+ antiporter subunit E [Mogibacterium sp.]
MKKNNKVLNFIVTAVLLMALWFVMSGKTETKFLILGALSSILIAFACTKTLNMKGALTDRTYYLLAVNPVKFIMYLGWLIYQIIKSAVYVSGVTLFRRSEVEPSIAWFMADYDNPSARAILANSITLTPGTITIDITESGIFSVHALTRSVREGLLDGTMQNKVAWLYGETINFRPVDESEVPEHIVKQEENYAPKRFIVRRKKA